MLAMCLRILGILLCIVHIKCLMTPKLWFIVIVYTVILRFLLIIIYVMCVLKQEKDYNLWMFKIKLIHFKIEHLIDTFISFILWYSLNKIYFNPARLFTKHMYLYTYLQTSFQLLLLILCSYRKIIFLAKAQSKKYSTMFRRDKNESFYFIHYA